MDINIATFLPASLEEMKTLRSEIGSESPVLGLGKSEKKIWIQMLLEKVSYEYLSREDKGLVRKFIQDQTGYSRAQSTRLIAEGLKGIAQQELLTMQSPQTWTDYVQSIKTVFRAHAPIIGGGTAALAIAALMFSVSTVSLSEPTDSLAFLNANVSRQYDRETGRVLDRRINPSNQRFDGASRIVTSVLAEVEQEDGSTEEYPLYVQLEEVSAEDSSFDSDVTAYRRTAGTDIPHLVERIRLQSSSLEAAKEAVRGVLHPIVVYHRAFIDSDTGESSSDGNATSQNVRNLADGVSDRREERMKRNIERRATQASAEPTLLASAPNFLDFIGVGSEGQVLVMRNGVPTWGRVPTPTKKAPHGGRVSKRAGGGGRGGGSGSPASTGPQGPQGETGPTLGIYDSLGLESSGSRAAGNAGNRLIFNLASVGINNGTAGNDAPLEVVGIASGSHIRAQNLLTSSGALIVEGNARLNSGVILNGVTYTFPGSDGSNTQVLSTDGNGGLSWVNSGGAGSTYYAGQGVSVASNVFSLNDTRSGSTITATTLLSGATVHAQNKLQSSGTLLVEGATTLEGTTTINDTTTLNANLVVDTDTLFVNTTTDLVGIGTASPAYELDVVGTIHASATLASSGTLVWEGAGSGASLYVANGFSGSGLTDCDNATDSKLLWDATTQRFSCGTDQSGGGGSVSAGQGITVAGSLVSLSAVHSGTTITATTLLSGATVHAQNKLHSSGTLLVEGATTLEGTVTLNGTAYTFPVGDGSASGKVLKTNGAGQLTWTDDTDTDTDTNTTYSPGQGIALNGTVFSLNDTRSGSTITATTLLSGATVHAQNKLHSSGTLLVEGATTINDTTTLNANLIVDTDTLFVNTTSDLVGIGTASPAYTLHVAGTIHSSQGLSSSGNLVWEDSASGATLTASTITAGSTFTGAGLSDCDNATNSKLLWDVTTKTFSCGTDTNTGTTYSAGQGIALNGTVFSLNDTRSGSTITATTLLSGATVHAQNKLHSSGTLLVEGATTLEGTVTLNGTAYTFPVGDGSASGKVLKTNGAGQLTWTDDTDTDTDTNTTYSPGQGIALNGTVFSLNDTRSGSTITATTLLSGATVHAQNKLHSSGTLLVEGATTLEGTTTINDTTTLNANLIVDTDTLFVNTTSDLVGIGTASPAYTLHVAGTIHSSQGLSSSGNLVWEDSASGATLTASTITAGSTFTGAGLSDCDNATNSKLLWDVTTKTFSCGTDTNTGTTYSAGQGIALNGTVFSLNDTRSGSTITATTLLSGATVHAQNKLHSSGTLLVEGATTLEGTTTINDTTTLNANLVVDTDTLFVNTTTDLVGIGTASPAYELDVVGTIHASAGLASSGTLVWEGAGSGASLTTSVLTVGSTLDGAGLSDCDNATTSKLLWDSTTQRFSCGSDQGGSNAPQAGQGLFLNGNNFFSLNDTRSGSTITATTLLSGATVHAQNKLHSSGTLLVEGATTLEGTVTLNGTAYTFPVGDGSASGKVLKTNGAGQLTWTDDTDTDTDTNTTYSPGQGIALNGTVFSLNDTRSGSTITATTLLSGATVHAQNKLHSSGTLLVEGATTLEGTTTINDTTTLNANLIVDTDTLFVNTTSDLVGIGTASPAYTLHVAGTIHSSQGLSSSGNLVWEDSASGATLTASTITAGSTFTGAGLSDCDNATNSKLLWDVTTKTFSCGTDTNTGTTYSAGQGIALNGTVFSLNDTRSGSTITATTLLSGATVHAQNKLHSSGTLLVEGATTLEGTVTLNGTAYTFPVGDGSASGKVLKTNGAGQLTWTDDTDTDTDTNTTYSPGQGIALNGTVFSLNDTRSGSTITATTLLSGATVHAQNKLHSSGTLLVEGATTLEGTTTINDTTTLNANLIVDTDTLFVNTTSDLVGIGTASPAYTLHVAGTIHSSQGLSSSGNLVWEDSASGATLTASTITAGSTFTGAGLSDCDNATNSKLLWDVTTKTFSCGTDTNTGTTYSAGQGIALNGTVFSLNDTRSGSTITATTLLSGATVHAQNKLHSSGTLLVEGATTLEGTVTLNGTAYTFPVGDGSASGKVLKTNGAGQLTWTDDTDTDTDTNTTYSPGQGIALNGTVFSLNDTRSGSTITATTLLSGATVHAQNKLHSSGTLLVEGATTLEGTTTINDTTTLNANLIVDTDTLFVNTTSDLVGIGTASPAYTLHVAGTIHSSQGLSSSGNLVWEDSASGATLTASTITAGSTFTGAGLSDCDNATNSKLLWDVTTKTFSCGTDQSGGGSVSAGQGITVAGSLVSLSAVHSGTTITATTLLSGAITHGQNQLRSSGTLTVETTSILKGALTVRDQATISGSVLPQYDNVFDLGSSTKRWKDLYLGPNSLRIGTNGNDATVSYNTANNTLKVNRTLSGVRLHADDSLTSSGTLVAEGATTLNANLIVDTDTLFVNTTSDLVGIGTASPAYELDIVGSIHASTGISSSGTLVWEGAASGASLYVANGFSGSGLTDCDNATDSKLLWDATTQRFSCGTDQSGGGGSVSAGQGITVAGSLVSLSAVHSGTTITATTLLSGATVHAQNKLHSSGTLLVEGATTLEGTTTINDTTTLNANLIVDTDTLFVNTTSDLVGIGTASPAYTLHVAGTIHSSQGLSSSGNLVWEDSASGATLTASTITAGSTFTGAGLSDCDADNQTLGWDVTTKKFTCGDDDTGGGSSGGTPNFDEVYAQSITDTNLTMEIDDSSGLTFDITGFNALFIIQDSSTNMVTFDTQNDEVAFGDNFVFNVGGSTGLDYNSITGSATADDATDDNDLFIEGTLEVDGEAEFDGGMEVDGTTYFDGTINTNNAQSDIQFANNVVLNLGGQTGHAYNSISGAASAGDATDDNDLFIEGTLEVDGEAELDGGMEVDGTSYFDGTISTNNSNGDLQFANLAVLNLGGSTGQAYNSISNTATAGDASDDNDLFIEGTLEVDGEAELDGGMEVDGTSYFDGSINTNNSNNDIQFANNVVLNLGGNTGQAYNSISNTGTATQASDDNDLYIEGILDTSSDIFGGNEIAALSLGSGGANDLCYESVDYSGSFYNVLYECSSSQRYKENFSDLNAGLDVISQLRSVTFDWKVSGKHDLGFVAEEVHAIDPILATFNKDGEIEGVKYKQLTAVIVNAIQEQQAQIEQIYSLIGTGTTSVIRIADARATVNAPTVIDIETTDPTETAFQIISDVAEDEDTALRIQADGTVYSDSSFHSTGADYAEYFRTKDADLKPGEVVCIDTTESNAVERCQSSADTNVMGIISSNPAFIGNQISGGDGLPVPGYTLVGLIGQVPVKAIIENGLDIRSGDALTPASIPGYARRARAGEPTVGIALESLEGTEGTINVLISRRNASLTVEAVEDHVIDTIALLEIEDEVSKLVDDSVDGVEFVEHIRAALGSASGSTLLPYRSSTKTWADELTFRQSITFEDTLSVTGSAHFANTITASGSIRTARLEANELTITGTGSVFNSLMITEGLRVQTLHVNGDAHVEGSLHTAALSVSSGSLLSGRTTLNGEFIVNGTTIDFDQFALKTNFGSGEIVDVSQLFVRGALTVEGDITVDGIATFLEDVEVQGEFIVNDRQAGYAVIVKDGTDVEIPFIPPFTTKPVITATADSFASWRMPFQSNTGFVLQVQEPAEEDITFTWHALAVKEAMSVRGAAAEVPGITTFAIDENGVPLGSICAFNNEIRFVPSYNPDGSVTRSQYSLGDNKWTHPDHLGLEFFYTLDRGLDEDDLQEKGYRAAVFEREFVETEKCDREDSEDPEEAEVVEEEPIEEAEETEEVQNAEETVEEEDSEDPEDSSVSAKATTDKEDPEEEVVEESETEEPQDALEEENTDEEAEKSDEEIETEEPLDSTQDDSTDAEEENGNEVSEETEEGEIEEEDVAIEEEEVIEEPAEEEVVEEEPVQEEVVEPLDSVQDDTAQNDSTDADSEVEQE